MAKKFEEFNKINEEGIAVASGAGSGMGAVVSAQPASVPGATVTGDGTTGSGDIAVPYMAATKTPANLTNNKKEKQDKEPKKYKFSDMIKFEDFDITKYLLESKEQEELDKIKSWLSDTTEEMDDFEWDGMLLTVFNNGEPIEKYTKKDLEDEGVFENINMKSIDSKEFQKLMKDVEKTLKSTSKKKAKDWKDEEEKDLFTKLDVKNWKDAYEKDPSACLAYKSRLDDYFNKSEESIKEDNNETDWERIDMIDQINYYLAGGQFKSFLNDVDKDKLKSLHSWIKEWSKR